MRKIYSKAGWLHYLELEFYYTQGEENVEPVQFVLPKNREEVDLTALSYQIKVVSEDYGTEAAWILPKKMTDEHILLDWEITREFTAMPGRAFLTLTGTDSKTTWRQSGPDILYRFVKTQKVLSQSRRRINWNSLKIRLTRQSKNHRCFGKSR